MNKNSEQLHMDNENTMRIMNSVFEKMLGSVVIAIKEIELLKRKEYLTPEEVETVYNLKATTLANKRLRGIGPSYIKDGEKILYAQSIVRNYLESRTVKTSN